MFKFKFFSLCLSALLIWKSQKMYGQDTIIIIGKAANAKYGAVVVSLNNDAYYLDKLEAWSPNYIDKSVKVTGKVFIKKIKGTRLNSERISGRITSPYIKIIKKPKIEILSDG